MCAAAPPAEPVLDLTEGAFHGPLTREFAGPPMEPGTGDGPIVKRPKRTALPLEVTIQGLTPSVACSGDRVTAEILVRNIGKEPVLIPSSKNDSEVIRASNRDQRELSVGLRLTHKGRQKTAYVCIGLAVGSASVEGTMITLWPQQALAIRGAGLLSDTWRWHEAGLPADAAAVKATVEEWFFDDDRYAVKAASDVVVSTNTFELVWKRER
jgi:hypothetical protein